MSKDILIVGESPSLNPRAKTILYDALLAAGIEEKDFCWVDVLKEAPPEGKNVTKTMVKNAKQHVLDRIEKRQPAYVVLLGNTACQAVLDQTGISKLRGKPFEKDNRIFLPLLHPHQALHDDKYAAIIESDCKRLKECIKHGGVPEEKALNFHIVDTWPKVIAMLQDLRGNVAVDLETTRLYPFTTPQDELITQGRATQALLAQHKATHGSNNLPRVVAMQFGTKRNQWVVPMETAGIWNEDRLKEIVRLSSIKLRDCKSIFHNGKFDALWMRVRFGVKWRVDFDTMLAHFLLDENDRHGLKELAQKMLGAPDWEIDVKDKTTWSNKNAKYAAHDVYYTLELYKLFLKQLREDGDTYRVFKHIMMPCVKLFIEAEFDGVQIDLDKMDDAERILREQVADAMANLEEWGKKAVKVDVKGKGKGTINWGSADQLGDLLFNVLKIKPIEKTKGGKNSVSESVLLRIDHPMVGDLLKFRAAGKQLSSFIEGWRPYLDCRGRLHPVFKLHGAVTGRLSCIHPNLQQVPRDPRIRSLITAPEGWTLVEMDLSQIELRIAAELANEYNLLSVFAARGDPHWTTATRELERGGGGDHVYTIKETARLFLLSVGLSPDGASTKILFDLWKANKGRASTIELLQMASKEWVDPKSGCGIGRQPEKRIKSLLERGERYLGEEVSERVLPELKKYEASLLTPQGRKQAEQQKIQFSDAMQVVSLIGASAAEEFFPVWIELRKKAKAVGFGYLYGMWWKKFKIYARDTYGVSVTDEEAQASREAFFELYPGFPEWHNKQRRFAQVNGYVRSLSGRKRRLPAATGGRDSPERREAQRQAINSPVQSYASDHNLMAALQMRKEFSRNWWRMAGTIHDAILMWVRNDKIEHVHKRGLEIMSSPELLTKFDIQLSVPIEANAKIGAWGIGKDIKKWRAANELQKAA